MAVIEACDGCGAHSPDKDGLHQANQWRRVMVKAHWRDDQHEFIFCQTCLPLPEKPLPSLRDLLKFKVTG